MRSREALVVTSALVFSSCIRQLLVYRNSYEDGIVMTINGLLDVGHTGAADFDFIPVERFVKYMVLMKFSFNI